MLNYIITIAISAFFVPHYLSIFWGPLRENPWDIVGGGIVIVLLVTLEHRRDPGVGALNIVLARRRLRDAAAARAARLRADLQPARARRRTSTAASRRPGASSSLAIPVAMIAYTGIETVSNLAEEARDPVTNIPRSIRLVAVAVFVDLLHAAAGSRSRRCPSPERRRRATRRCSASARPSGFSNDPVLGLVENLGLHGAVAQRAEDLRRHPRGDDPLHRHERRRDRRLAHHLRDGELPPAARGLPAAASASSRRRGISLLVFAGVIPIIVHAPGQDGLPRDDVLVRRDALVHDRARLDRRAALQATVTRSCIYRARPNLRCRGVDWPLFAIFGGLGTGARRGSSWSCRSAATRWAGLGWLAAGFVIYAVYRRRAARAAERDGARADPDRARGRARVPQRARPDRAPARVGGGGRPRLPPRHRAAARRSSR